MENAAVGVATIVITLLARELLPALFNGVKAIREQKQKANKEATAAGRRTHKEVTDEYKQLVGELRTRCDELEQRIDTDRAACVRRLDEERSAREQSEKLCGRMRERILYHEELMTEKGIRFRAWTEEATGTFRPLPPGTLPPAKPPEGD